MTLDEIAKLAGVSKTTASYVINGKAQKYRISEKTQMKVMAVVEEYNFRPDHAASSLRAGKLALVWFDHPGFREHQLRTPG